MTFVMGRPARTAALDAAWTTTGVAMDWTRAIAEYDEHGKAAGRPETTRRTRREHLHLLAKTIDVEPWAVTAADLLAWFAGQEWSVETRRSRRTTLRGFYAWAVAEGRLSTSPALALPPVRPSRPNPRPVPDAAYRLAWAEASPRERLMLRLAAEHGLRRAEISVVHSRDLVEDLDGWSLVVHGKGGRERLVPLTRAMALALRSLPAGWAFPGRQDGHLSPRWIGTVIGRLLPEGYTVHKLRHRAGTRWWESSGRDLFAVQELLGHADPKTTRVYVKVDTGRLRTTVEGAA